MKTTFTITDPLHGLVSETGELFYRDGKPVCEKKVFEAATGELVCKLVAPLHSSTANISATIAAVEAADLATLAGETQRVDVGGLDGRWWITTRIRSEQTCGDWATSGQMVFDTRNEAQCQLRRMARAKASLSKAA